MFVWFYLQLVKYKGKPIGMVANRTLQLTFEVLKNDISCEEVIEEIEEKSLGNQDGNI